MVGMHDDHQGKRCLENDRSRQHGILLLQANERRRGEDDYMVILLDSFGRNTQSRCRVWPECLRMTLHVRQIFGVKFNG